MRIIQYKRNKVASLDILQNVNNKTESSHNIEKNVRNKVYLLNKILIPLAP